MAHCSSSDPSGKIPRPDSSAVLMAGSPGSVDQAMKPVLFEIFGEIWNVQARLGQGVSASVYRVSSGRTSTAAVKEFLADAQGGDYGYHKERSVLEDIQGHKNIVTLYGVFTNHSHVGVATRCLLLELLDVSVSELLVRASTQGQVGSLQSGGAQQQGHSMWLVQHCARDILEALAFLHREGYVHADLKPRNVLWSADDECFKLIDFGLSFKEGNQDVKYIQTDGYRAPEAELQNSLAQVGLEAEGNSGCSATVDLWSLGIILLEMYSGIKLKDTVRSPEWKDNSAAIVDHIFASNSVVCPAIPVYHLRDLIKSMLHNDPKHRGTAETALLSPFFSIPFAPHIEDLVLLPSPVLRLLNLIDDSHLHNEEEYEDILEDMKEECQKYGSVVSLLIPKENPGKGQVFVEYANAGDSKEAQRLLTGRTFDRKFVVATFYPLSAYKRGYLYQTVQ
ncbi:serine/threonine-protein kinase Kist isoform X1 [Salmo salar]|uniref:Serine/threonine-protein kinase Kist n=2 Tax=Salmo TaxID=8028 RepID=A0A673YUZ1_SALTR|nr:serine/threonine-protein kinase Kist isoform X1 [Salmo salar]XP_029563519.1 serine/threonine-protein kinase Kist-like [Salmo trutta]|eukprot:XP_013978519.1 PREDICTED: serine/threonine-protein kinase Kist isoform X1 [Salmo salar]